MPSYSIVAPSVAAAAGAAYCALNTSANFLIRIQKVSFFCTAATLSPVRLYRALTVGTPTSGAITPQSLALSAPTATEAFHTTWSPAPTVTAAAGFDGAYIPASIGAGYIWIFDFGIELEIDKSSALLLWNPSGSAGSVGEVTIKYRI